MAAPVSEVRATSLVGRLSVPVKWPVSQRMTAARTMPSSTARVASSRGSLPATVAREEPWATLTPVSSPMVDGR